MIALELRKHARRLRTWIGFGGLVVLPVIATIATKVSPGEGATGPERTVYDLTRASAINDALAALTFMSPFFLVVVVSAFAGDSVAGEASWGTLRYLLVRPVTRTRLRVSKFLSVAILAVAATVAIVAAALAAGTIAFGWHPVRTVFGLEIARGQAAFGLEIAQGQAMARLGLATAYVAWGLFGLVAFAFLLSTLTDAAAGAIGGAVGLAVASQILDAISGLRDIRYGLPTHYWSAWSRLFLPGASTAEMWRGVLLQAAYLVVFGGAAWWWFRRKDVLS